MIASRRIAKPVPEDAAPRSAAHPRRASSVEAFAAIAIVGTIAALWIASRFFATNEPLPAEEHATSSVANAMVALGEGRFHARGRIDRDGKISLLTLGSDASRVIDVENQTLLAAAVDRTGRATPVELTPDPQPGDGENRTSRFVGDLPQELVDQPLEIEIVPLRIGAERFRVAFRWPPELAVPTMPAPASADEEQELYRKPGGAYTAADIAANGSQLPSEKFADFRPEHDPSPLPGDVICPITRTKANPACSWVVAGRRYEFCCPPCIDEFVRLAKERPEAIEPPEAYVLR